MATIQHLLFNKQNLWEFATTLWLIIFCAEMFLWENKREKAQETEGLAKVSNIYFLIR